MVAFEKWLLWGLHVAVGLYCIVKCCIILLLTDALYVDVCYSDIINISL